MCIGEFNEQSKKASEASSDRQCRNEDTGCQMKMASAAGRRFSQLRSGPML